MRNVSMQSGWKMCRQGSSRTCDSFATKSSRHIGQVGWENAGEMEEEGGGGVVVVCGADVRRVMGKDFAPTPASMVGEGML